MSAETSKPPEEQRIIDIAREHFADLVPPEAAERMARSRGRELGRQDEATIFRAIAHSLTSKVVADRCGAEVIKPGDRRLEPNYLLVRQAEARRAEAARQPDGRSAREVHARQRSSF